MPDFTLLLLRYFGWQIGLRLLYVILLALTGLPPGFGMQVILAAVPGIEIAAHVVRKAGHVPSLGWWLRLLLGLFAVHMAIELAQIAFLAPQLFEVLLAFGQGAGAILTAWGMVLPMLALFLWLGARSEAKRNGKTGGHAE